MMNFFMKEIFKDDKIEKPKNEKLTSALFPPIQLIDNNPETDEQILERLKERFDLLEIITMSVREAISRGVIIYGAPGCGKSFGVEKVLNEGTAKFKIIKGYVTPAGLYQLLYDNQKKILVFDDSDEVLNDEISLNTLKGALDTSPIRNISWNTAARLDSKYPREFEYKGRIIFITNKNIEAIVENYKQAEANGKGSFHKLAPHYDALLSRADYLDLCMDTPRERFLRIAQIVRDNRMLIKLGLTQTQSEDVLGYIQHNIENMRELSIRTALRIAGYMRLSKDKWVPLADAYVLRRQRTEA